MYEKLDEIEKRYEELQQKMADPAVATDVAIFRDTMKAVSEIDDVVAKYRELKDIRKRLGDAREMLKSDDDMRELAEMEIAELEPKAPALEKEIQLLLQPKDPNDDKNVFVEIRAGTGGDEASLFAAEIMRMYIRYAETKRWKVDMTDANYSSVNGIKDAVTRLLDVPAQLTTRVVFDQSLFVKRAIETLLEEGGVGLALTAVMVLIFLGSMRATVAVFFSIPLSALATLIALQIGGSSINTMVLGGLALAFSRLIESFGSFIRFFSDGT